MISGVPSALPTALAVIGGLQWRLALSCLRIPTIALLEKYA
jgi:hypothetical protein